MFYIHLSFVYFLWLVSTNNAYGNFTTIGVFLNMEEDRHGGYMEGGLTIVIDKINDNSSILANTKLRLFHHVTNCDKKQILTGIIEFASPNIVDLVIGDTCGSTTELAGLMASKYNKPMFDFATRPQYSSDKRYDTLLRTIMDAAVNIRIVYSVVTEYQNFRWTCLYMPQQIMSNIKHVRESYALYERKLNVTVREVFYYNMVDSEYTALRRLKISCRGNSPVFASY